MVKGKINIVVGDVVQGRGSKPLQVALSDKTTTRDIINVILKKYSLDHDPFNYQLWESCPPDNGKLCKNMVTCMVINDS